MMRAGRLDRYVRIEQKGTQQDSYGQEVELWLPFADAWAEKVDLAGREFLTAGAERSETVTLFRTHWQDGIQARMRLVEGCDVYDIEGVIEIGRRDGIELSCKRVQP